MDERVLVSTEGRFAHVELNRADKRNGLDLPMFEALARAGERLVEDRTVRAVVLSGRGRAFCAGLDFQAFMSNPDAPGRLLERASGEIANLAQKVALVWRQVPVPVICAIQGQAFGGGLQIALGADIRLVHPDAELSVMEARWGLVPDMGASQTLLSAVRLDVAKELTFSARRVRGTEAVLLGLATRTSEDPVVDARALAAEFAQRSPHALAAAKQLYERAPTLSAADALELESRLQKELLMSPNQLEAVQANMAGRTPNFEDPK